MKTLSMSPPNYLKYPRKTRRTLTDHFKIQESLALGKYIKKREVKILKYTILYRYNLLQTYKHRHFI